MRHVTKGLVICAFAIFCIVRGTGQSADQVAKPLVRRAVQAELAADQADHSHWLYFEVDRKADRSVKQWVAETKDGSLRRIVEMNGQSVAPTEQRRKVDSFLRDSWARSRQRKAEQHDDAQAAELLRLLPDAFRWTKTGEKDGNITLHFVPDPQFRAPDLEARVFAAMEGDMVVDKDQLRIVSLKGKLIHNVKIAGGFLGNLNAGGTFDVERRQLARGVWQITETHVHIQGHALIFKSISEQEDDQKTSFKALSDNVTMQQVEGELMTQVK